MEDDPVRFHYSCFLLSNICINNLLNKYNELINKSNNCMIKFQIRSNKVLDPSPLLSDRHTSSYHWNPSIFGYSLRQLKINTYALFSPFMWCCLAPGFVLCLRLLFWWGEKHKELLHYLSNKIECSRKENWNCKEN